MQGPTFGIDGMELMDKLVIAGTKDPYSKQLLVIGKRYGLNTMQMMALIQEMCVVMQQQAAELERLASEQEQ